MSHHLESNEVKLINVDIGSSSFISSQFKNILNHCICNNFEYNILTHIRKLYKCVHNAQSQSKSGCLFFEYFTRKIIILN